MPRALRRVITVQTQISTFPFDGVDVFPDVDVITPEGIALLERPFTAGTDTGPEALIVAPGYNYARDSITLDLVVADTTIFNTAFSPITL